MAPSPQPSLGTLLTSMFDDATTLFRQEIQLARLELGHKLQRAAGGATKLLSGALLAYLGLVTLVIVGLLALANVLPLWAAGVVMGLLVIVIGGVLVQSGRNSLRNLSIIPQQTVASTQADVAMVSNRISSTQDDRVASAHRERPKAEKSRSKSKDAAAQAVDAGRGSIWQVLKTTYTEWTEDEASLLAAALSYYTAISLAPLLVLVVVIVGLFLSQDAARDRSVGATTRGNGHAGRAIPGDYSGECRSAASSESGWDLELVDPALGFHERLQPTAKLAEQNLECRAQAGPLDLGNA